LPRAAVRLALVVVTLMLAQVVWVATAGAAAVKRGAYIVVLDDSVRRASSVAPAHAAGFGLDVT
jgi:hypothetical protein